MKKILVIDDDEGIKDALKSILEMEGFNVETDHNAQNLLQKTQQLPELIILDYFLGGVNGQTVAKTIRENICTKDIPIIMFSADPNNRKKINSELINDFLDKPFEMDDLINIVSKHLPN